KNEVFLDVVESVNLMTNSSGSVVRSEVLGSIRARSQLSGMPECRLGLNDMAIFQQEGKRKMGRAGVAMEDVKFHQCVRLSK
ncbi:hypothetical protein PMAYCL1PPCAC_26153, partial [Pristionchus mayeri]